MSIFKAYDIRGTYPDQVNKDLAFKVGQGFVAYLKEKGILQDGEHVLVSRDVRNSSPEICESLINGITSTGHDVDFLGVTPTDIFYYTAGAHDYSGGIMVTASHNPPQYNGFKIVRKGVNFVAGEELQAMKLFVEKDHDTEGVSRGRVAEKSVIQEYADWVVSVGNVAGLSKRFKIVADPGNGTVTAVTPAIFPKLPVDATVINEEPSGDFPGRGPDPAKNHIELSERVIADGCDLGAAWDNDSDRIVFVDELGAEVGGDIALAILSKYALKNNPGASIVHDLICSKSVIEIVNEEGGTPVRSRVGHAFIKQNMKASGSIVGGEVSGHFYYRNEKDGQVWFGENTWLVLIQILHVLDQSGKSLSQVVAEVTRYQKNPVITFEISDSAPVIAALQEKYSDGQQDTLDGLTVDYGDWWFNARPSNTEPILKLVIEAKTRELLDQKIAEVTEAINQAAG